MCDLSVGNHVYLQNFLGRGHAGVYKQGNMQIYMISRAEAMLVVYQQGTM